MPFGLMCCTKVLLGEIADRKMSQRQVALSYCLAIKSNEETDWKRVNAAIIKRWGAKRLEKIKRAAWKLVEGRGSERETQ